MDFLTTPLGDESAALLRAKFDEFARKHKEEIVLHQIERDSYWRELVNVSVHHLGADLAEIGSTWVEPLTAMNVLAPFSKEEIDAIGGEQSFFSSSWQTVRHENGRDAWGIPVRLDVRMIFYWQDMFDAAGVDPRQTFSSAEAMKDGFEKLQRSVPHPWGVITTRQSHELVYNLASWIWAEGGDFISQDGEKLLINTPETQRGIKNYYDLSKFMPPESRDSTNETVLQLFAERKIAATLQGSWLIQHLQGAGLTPTMLDLVNVASPPGPAFFGGIVLARWKHSRKEDLAGKLIRALSERDFSTAFAATTRLLPSHKGAWTAEFLQKNKYNAEYYESLLHGRCLHPVRLWGMIEDRLTQTLGSIWEDLYALPEKERPKSVETVMAKHLRPLTTRFEMILKGYHRS